MLLNSWEKGKFMAQFWKYFIAFPTKVFLDGEWRQFQEILYVVQKISSAHKSGLEVKNVAVDLNKTFSVHLGGKLRR